MNANQSSAQNNNGNHVGSITEGFRNMLFLALAALSIAYFITILLRFCGFPYMAEVPQPLMDNIYIAGLVIYMGAKQISKACNGGQHKQRRGEHFVVAWIAITTALLVSATFRIGDPLVIEEIWPHPLAEVVGLFIGNETLKTRAEIIRSLAQTIGELRSEVLHVGQKTKGTP